MPSLLGLLFFLSTLASLLALRRTPGTQLSSELSSTGSIVQHVVDSNHGIENMTAHDLTHDLAAQHGAIEHKLVKTDHSLQNQEVMVTPALEQMSPLSKNPLEDNVSPWSRKISSYAQLLFTYGVDASKLEGPWTAWQRSGKILPYILAVAVFTVAFAALYWVMFARVCIGAHSHSVDDKPARPTRVGKRKAPNSSDVSTASSGGEGEAESAANHNEESGEESDDDSSSSSSDYEDYEDSDEDELAPPGSGRRLSNATVKHLQFTVLSELRKKRETGSNLTRTATS